MGGAQQCGHFTHTVHIGILRANKQIHRKAYDLMVKTNRFIHVKQYGATPILELLANFTRRIISCHGREIEHFKGCVLEVSTVGEGRGWYSPEEYDLFVEANKHPLHAMILGKDVEGLIQTLTNLHMPALNRTLAISLTLALNVEKLLPSFKKSLTELFSEKTQETILLPFRNKLRGVKRIQIAGVNKELAKVAKADMAREEWTDATTVLEDLRASKDRGKGYFAKQELRLASQTWDETINTIELIHASSSWAGLCKTGGKEFVDNVSELYFLTSMNVAHVQLGGVNKPIPGYPSEHDARYFLRHAHEQLIRINEAEKPDYWMKSYVWKRTDEQNAKLAFRKGLVCKSLAQVF